MSLPKIDTIVAIEELRRDAYERDDKIDIAFYDDLLERIAKAVDTFNGRHDLHAIFEEHT